MSLGTFVKNLFSRDAPITISDDPFGRQQSSPAIQNTKHHDPHTPFVHRQEILSERSRLVGYRFDVRTAQTDISPSPAQFISALIAEGIKRFAQRRLAVLPIDPTQWFDYNLRQFVAPNLAFLLDITAQDTTTLMPVLEDIKRLEGRVALSGMIEANRDDVLSFADLVVLNFGHCELKHLEALIRKLKHHYPKLEIAIEGVQSWAEQRCCHSYGAHYSLGDFVLTTDSAEPGDKLNQSRIVILEMLNLLRRDTDLEALAAVAKRDPTIAMHIVRMANSPLSGLTNPIASLDQAIVVLGRQVLYRWLSISMFRAGSHAGRDEALLELALCRARLLELLAQATRSKQECDELFLVGLFSLLDSLLGMTMHKILERMHLPENVVDVLLRSEGPYGPYLLLAIHLEKGKVDMAERQAEKLNIAIDTLTICHGDALAWAEEAIQMGEETHD